MNFLVNQCERDTNNAMYKYPLSENVEITMYMEIVYIFTFLNGFLRLIGIISVIQRWLTFKMKYAFILWKKQATVTLC